MLCSKEQIKGEKSLGGEPELWTGKPAAKVREDFLMLIFKTERERRRQGEREREKKGTVGGGTKRERERDRI